MAMATTVAMTMIVAMTVFVSGTQEFGNKGFCLSTKNTLNK